jgi:hypothetical protein
MIELIEKYIDLTEKQRCAISKIKTKKELKSFIKQIILNKHYQNFNLNYLKNSNYFKCFNTSSLEYNFYELDNFRQIYKNKISNILSNIDSIEELLQTLTSIDLTNLSFINEEIIENLEFIYCPICNEFIYFESDYLKQQFKNDVILYNVACLVTHYRHNHINYYDRSWKYYKYRDKNKEYQKVTHEEYRIIVNNRAKRQLIRKLRNDNNLTLEGRIEFITRFKYLQNNDEKTNELIDKTLERIKVNI